MKIPVTLLMLSFILLLPQDTQSFFDSPDEHEFIEQMNAIEQMIQKSFNNFHTQFFEKLDKQQSHLNDQLNQLNSQKNLNFYQENSSSLAFANKEKAFEIKEQTNQNGNKLYRFAVTNKTINSTENTDPKNDLKEILSYIQKHFKIANAETIITSCIKTITENSTDQLVTIETSNNGNRKEYIIKVAYKKSTQNPDNEENQETETVEDEDEKNNKKKKYAPRDKKIKS